MNRRINDIITKVFENVPYSKASEEAKTKIGTSMESEYDKLSKDGCNELQALGSVMQKYGSFGDAAAVSGVTDTDTVTSEENALSKKTFSKDFRKYRIWAALSAIFLSAAAVHNQVYIGNWLGVITLVAYAVIGVLLFMPCRRLIAKYDYDKIKLSPKARDKFHILSDRYKKRSINSFILLIVLTVNFISLTFERALCADMNGSELKVLIISNAVYIQVGVAVCIWNIMNTVFLCRATDEESRKAVRRYIVRSGVICGTFLAGAIGLTALMSLVLYNPYMILYICTIIFVTAFVLTNLKKRSSIVIRNIRVNKPRIAVAVAAVMAFGGIKYMKADNWLLQPYIMTIPKVEHTEHDITYDGDTGVFTISADDGDFKILHLTDIHIGGSAFSAYKDFMALDACYRLIDETRPDFVVVTGDMVFPMGIMSLSLNNQSPVMQFANFMRNVDIPWAFTFGNHDTEAMASGSRDDICRLYTSLSYVNAGNLLYPDVQPRITGRSNQMIKLQNPDGTTRQALFLIDSNDYTGAGINDYDYIHDDQVDWYEKQVKSLDEGVKSMMFFHIPLREYADAYKLYEEGSDEVKYFFGEIGETMINPICCSNYESRIFDKAVELGSTQAMFCGHDHYNNISMEYKGIRLSYGMSIDYLAMPGISKDTKQRGGELITVHADGSFDLSQIPLESLK